MDLEPDAVAPRLASTLRYLVAGLPGGWSRSEGGATGICTGAPLPTLNGVWQQLAQPDEEAVDGLLDAVAATGVPYCLQVRPGVAGRLEKVATARGMTAADGVPLMALAGPDRLEPAPAADGLVIEELPAERAEVHARLVAEAFGAPVEVFVALFCPALLRLAGVRCYVGLSEGEPVTTCLTSTLGGAAAVFNVGTRAAWRGRGYGSAITSHAVTESFGGGAQWAWLQSSAAGLGVYSRLGFSPVEVWPTWVCFG